MQTQMDNGRSNIERIRQDSERFRQEMRWEPWKALGTILAAVVAMWGVFQLLINPQVRQLIEHLSIAALVGIVFGSILVIVLLNVGIPLYLRGREQRESHKGQR